MKLSSSTVNEVATLFSVAPRKLLRAVAKNWETGRQDADYARQMILDAANADGPGMASRGEWAHSMINLLLLTVDGPLPTFCECRCGCKSRASATFCGPCGRGCCGETAESFRQEEQDWQDALEQDEADFACDRPAPEPEEDHLAILEAMIAAEVAKRKNI